MAIDVFYLTSGGAKLSAAQRDRLRDVLMEKLADKPQV